MYVFLSVIAGGVATGILSVTIGGSASESSNRRGASKNSKTHWSDTAFAGRSI